VPLVARLPGHHTIQTFRAAASLRYNEARRLAIAGDRLAAIYLSGYAAEMLLKAAYFRLEGRGPADPITLTDLGNAKKHAMTVLGLSWPENLHDLRRWRDLLVEEHKQRGSAYAPAFVRSFSARVRQVYLNWREYLRYHANRPYQGEVNRTLQALQWLLSQYRYL
jgi:HEPN domain-containing protein